MPVEIAIDVRRFRFHGEMNVTHVVLLPRTAICDRHQPSSPKELVADTAPASFIIHSDAAHAELDGNDASDG